MKTMFCTFLGVRCI